MKLYTIGFTKKSAEDFFELLAASGARRLVDIRLRNASQLAGFAKRDDLEYLVGRLCGMDYVHMPELAPDAELLDDYRKKRIDWSSYVPRFLALMEERRTIEKPRLRETLDGGCLLCAEHSPERCHRRLVAEYLSQKWGDVEIVHLT